MSPINNFEQKKLSFDVFVLLPNRNEAERSNAKGTK